VRYFNAHPKIFEFNYCFQPFYNYCFYQLLICAAINIVIIFFYYKNNHHMKNPKILLNFSSLSNPKMLAKAEFIETSMNGNANFPAPVPTIAELTSAVNAYSGAFADAQSGDKTKIEIRKEMRQQLETLLVSLSAYVTQVANGNRSILVSSGYTVSSESKSKRTIGALENFQVVQGINPGEAISSLDSVDYSTGYMHQYTTDPLTAESNWTTVTSTYCSETIKGLQPLTKYWFRIIVTGRRKQTAQTDAISKTIV
jgi:hypothetical protein